MPCHATAPACPPLSRPPARAPAGEGERLVRALFGLAHKLSPSVVFVDEIDSFLSKRGDRSTEHEALRKMKNEFM